MLNQSRSFSPFSCINNIENLASLSWQLRATVRRRSASDSVALKMTKPYFINTGDNFSGQGELEPNHGDDYRININCDKNFAQADDSSKKMEPQKIVPNYDHDNMDTNKIKQMLANRLSAQRSRLRKLEYIDKLKSAIDNEECKLLEIKNHEMEEEMEALENERASREAEFQALPEERHALVLAYKLLE